MKKQFLHSTEDLTTGSPALVILKFALPVIAGLIFQQFYSIVDTAIVGQFLGVNALAGVGATVSISYFFIGLGTGCCAGFGICTATRHGANDQNGVQKSFSNGLYMILVIGCFVALVTTILSHPILDLLKTPDDIMMFSLAYIRIIFMGLPICFLYNFLAAMIRALGNSRTPLVILIVSSAVNVFLDMIFIAVFRMGIAGAALATVLSQGISVICCMIHIRKQLPDLIPRRDLWRPDWHQQLELLSIGLPIGFQSSIMSVGTIILQSAENLLGASVVAASTAGGKIGYFFAVFFEGLGTALVTYISQNRGAGKSVRIRAGIRSSFFIGSVYCTISICSYILLGKYIVKWYLGSTEPRILMWSFRYSMFMILFLPAVMFLNLFRYTLQSAGLSGHALFAGIFELIGRFIVASFVIPRFGFSGACASNPIAWTLAALVISIIILVKKDMVFLP